MCIFNFYNNSLSLFFPSKKFGIYIFADIIFDKKIRVVTGIYLFPQHYCSTVSRPFFFPFFLARSSNVSIWTVCFLENETHFKETYPVRSFVACSTCATSFVWKHKARQSEFTTVYGNSWATLLPKVVFVPIPADNASWVMLKLPR